MDTYSPKGFETEADALQKVEDLREAYRYGHGFYLVRPPHQLEDGTWGFTFRIGSSCD